MIKLTDARLTDALPKTLAEQPWVQALAEASRKMRRRVMAYADRTRLFCDIDEASEEALDALAVELQTPLYKNDYPLTVKRQIVKNSMLYYIRSGTRGAVEELLADIYQGAEVEEWFEYGGKPNYFRVAIDISRTTVPVAEMAPAELESWLYSVKRASSALESLSYMIRHAITIGCKVVVADRSGKEMPAYRIVGSQEADPMHGVISEESPFGKALMGAKEGDEISVEAPVGIIHYRVEKIER